MLARVDADPGTAVFNNTGAFIPRLESGMSAAEIKEAHTAARKIYLARQPQHQAEK